MIIESYRRIATSSNKIIPFFAFCLEFFYQTLTWHAVLVFKELTQYIFFVPLFTFLCDFLSIFISNLRETFMIIMNIDIFSILFASLFYFCLYCIDMLVFTFSSIGI